MKITVNPPNDMAKTPSLRLSKDLDPQALVITRVSRVALDASGFMGVFAMNEGERDTLTQELGSGPCGVESRAPWMCRT